MARWAPSRPGAFVRSLVHDHGIAPEQAATIPITGSPAEVAERFAAYALAGVERLVLSLYGREWMRQCELLAKADALLSNLSAGRRQ
jgi:alkanesulfonate monooxygenase SsuD/methylene tetrahydromethanopterin reductase-like flavin-dependent oxidoreductase (luciferase family)